MKRGVDCRKRGPYPPGKKAKAVTIHEHGKKGITSPKKVSNCGIQKTLLIAQKQQKKERFISRRKRRVGR